MAERIRSIPLFFREIIFQVMLHLVVFVFYAFDKNQPYIEGYQAVFFLNYAMAAFIVNYLLLPRFFFRKKYLYFSLYVLLLLMSVMFIEEAILEKLFFPETRGRTVQIYAMVGILPVVAILSGFKFAWDALQKQREVEELRATVEKSELQFLKSQINPHFLFNNLNNLYSHAIENSPKTPSIILELSSVLRYMLYECREQYVSLSKELEQLENFTRLNQLQIEERGRVSFEAVEAGGGYKIAPLILIVFIENAFKHSQSCQSDNISIEIRIGLSNEGLLEFYCRNSFRPLASHIDYTSGIGLENVQKRLEMLYPNAHSLEISEHDYTYEVRLSLQLTTTDIP